MIPNEPAVILDVDRDSWACKKAWSTNDQFDIFKFCELYKDLIAPVYDCEKAYHNSNPCEDMKIGDFLSVWVSDVNGSKYLKDWHLYKEHDKHFYSVPIYFQSDWLNEYYDHLGTDDYRFVY